MILPLPTTTGACARKAPDAGAQYSYKGGQQNKNPTQQQHKESAARRARSQPRGSWGRSREGAGTEGNSIRPRTHLRGAMEWAVALRGQVLCNRAAKHGDPADRETGYTQGD